MSTRPSTLSVSAVVSMRGINERVATTKLVDLLSSDSRVTFSIPYLDMLAYPVCLIGVQLLRDTVISVYLDSVEEELREILVTQKGRFVVDFVSFTYLDNQGTVLSEYKNT